MRGFPPRGPCLWASALGRFKFTETQSCTGHKQPSATPAYGGESDYGGGAHQSTQRSTLGKPPPLTGKHPKHEPTLIFQYYTQILCWTVCKSIINNLYLPNLSSIGVGKFTFTLWRILAMTNTQFSLTEPQPLNHPLFLSL